MWTLIQKFALGATLAGFVTSFLAVFLFRDYPPALRDAPMAAFFGAAAAGVAFACTAALVYGAGIKIFRTVWRPNLALVLGAASAIAQYLVSALARLLISGQDRVLDQVLLASWIAAPVAAALISRVRLSRSPGQPVWYPQP